MRGKALTNTDIKRQLARGRNYERLYRELKPKYDAALSRIAELESQLATQEQHFQRQFQTQAARIEQLEAMVFGRKSKLPKQPKLHLTTKRDSQTYHRPLPPASAITGEETFRTNVCHRCGHDLTDKTVAVRYEEDIILPVIDARANTKTVTKQYIEQGWCSRCGQYSSAKDLRGQAVALGPVVRSYIVYLTCQLDLSYAQAQELLCQQHRLYVSSSELTTILDEQRKRYLPEYQRSKQRVRAGPSHLDESRYPIQSEQGDVMTGADGTDAAHDVVYARGKAHSQQLIGEHYQHVGITDRYGSYKHLFVAGYHQICWAHLARTAKDITRLECLDEAIRQGCREFYAGLSQLYGTVRQVWAEVFDKERRQTQADQLLPQIIALCQKDAADPKQLHDLKAGILDYRDCLLVCLTEPNVPPDNNKAERALRKLVIKRKKSLGVKSLKGARTMEVLHSICQSVYNRDKDNLLPDLFKLAIAA